jgi:hypothetical protein
MQLKVNDDEIAFTLEEGENELGQILDGLLNYLQGEGYGALQVYANGVLVDRAEDNWRSISLDGLKLLHIKGEQVLSFTKLQEALSRVNLALSSANNGPMLSQVQNEWPQINLAVKFWLASFGLGNDFFKAFETLPDSFNLDSFNTTAAQKLIEQCGYLLAEKERELLNPQGEIIGVINTLAGFSDKLIPLSVQFQSNNDGKAMQTVLAFMQSFQKFVRLATIVFAGHSIAQRELVLNFIEEVSDYTTQFTIACENRDYILAGDIAEYELAPRLNAFVKLAANTLLPTIKQ